MKKVKYDFIVSIIYEEYGYSYEITIKQDDKIVDIIREYPSRFNLDKFIDRFLKEVNED